jgi:hypothetical protein
MVDINKKIFYECGCHSVEHTISFELTQWEDNDPCMLSLEVQLIKYQAWYKRIWPAIKYLIGMESQAHWDGWILSYKDANKLKEMVDYYVEMERIHEEKQQIEAVYGEDKPVADC